MCPNPSSILSFLCIQGILDTHNNQTTKNEPIEFFLNAFTEFSELRQNTKVICLPETN